MRSDNQRGASAVEFAIVLPILLTLLIGIIEFSYMFNQQISLSQGARQGAREFAIHHENPSFDPTDAVHQAAPALDPDKLRATRIPASGTCAVGDNATVTATLSYRSLTGWFPFLDKDLIGVASMRCGG